MPPGHVSASDVLVRVILLFLVAMAVLALFGRLRMPRLPGVRPPPPGLRPPAPVVCIRCGTPVPGGGDCPCGAPRKG